MADKRRSPWEIAEEWYKEDEIFHYLKRDDSQILDSLRNRAFANWMTNQYRLAMAKGIQLGSRNLRMTPEQTIAATSAELDQDWSEAVEWFEGSVWTPQYLARFTHLLCCETEALRKLATTDELDIIQRLGRIAFYEVWKRHIERSQETDGIDN